MRWYSIRLYFRWSLERRCSLWAWGYEAKSNRDKRYDLYWGLLKFVVVMRKNRLFLSKSNDSFSTFSKKVSPKVSPKMAPRFLLWLCLVLKSLYNGDELRSRRNRIASAIAFRCRVCIVSLSLRRGWLAKKASGERGVQRWAVRLSHFMFRNKFVGLFQRLFCHWQWCCVCKCLVSLRAMRVLNALKWSQWPHHLQSW